jgi:predicted transcriptional regulator
MMKYRSSVEIASSILRVAVGGRANKTKLMYGASLSFTQITDYLQFLVTNGLIESEPIAKVYVLTDRGLRFLNLYEEMTKLVPEVASVPAV